MQWYGKAIGGILGFAAAGPIGSLLGVLLGHQFDQGLRVRGSAAGASRDFGLMFFQVAFETMGHVAKVDGRVSEEEIRVARRIMHGMQLSPEQVKAAIERFTAGKGASYPLTERLSALSRSIGDRRELARAFVEIQMQAAVAAGQIGTAKRQVLWRVARGLDIGRVELAQIEALVRAHEHRSARGPGGSAGLEAAYRVLGVASDAGDGAVKTAYRRLMNQHHPDKLVSRGLPESMAGVAEQKTLEIRSAYERIKAHRGFK